MFERREYALMRGTDGRDAVGEAVSATRGKRDDGTGIHFWEGKTTFPAPNKNLSSDPETQVGIESNSAGLEGARRRPREGAPWTPHKEGGGGAKRARRP